MPAYDELWKTVSRIPAGQVSCYGDVGKAMKHPVSGLLVGRWMKSSPVDLPWWRVVGKDGSFPIAKQSPEQAVEQEERLRAEGVTIKDGRVDAAAFIDYLELLEE